MTRCLITSALPYINGIKHLGNLAGSMLPADIYARYRRMRGDDVLYICATDEHGTPAELAADEAGQSVRVYCDEQHEIQKGIYRRFGLSFDWFGRTSSPQNCALTQHFCERLEANGLIEERTTEQVYSIDDGRFLPDRYVEGTCPKCGYGIARGDQCDSCGTLLDPTDLIDPRSKISGSTNLEVRPTAHLFLMQDRMQDEVREWVDAAHGWPALTVSIAHKWLDEGLKERSITRDLKWGVPVTTPDGAPRPGFENKVFYVWFDAPIGYIGATQEWAQGAGGDWESWWRTDRGADDVEYVQFMGKDNVAFHTVSFPVTLLGSKEPWKMVDRLKSFNWLDWYGEKFSTSQKRGVFTDQALDLLPADYWRWYLMANAPEGGDHSFTWERFQSTCNTDLANNLGNFVNRITRFCAARFDGAIPEGGAVGDAEHQLYKDLDGRMTELRDLHDQIEIRKAAGETRAIWGICNEYITAAAPWTTIKTDRDTAAAAVRMGLNLCVLSARIARPFIPETADKILDAFGLKDDPSMALWPEGGVESFLDVLKPGAPLTPPPVLFARIEDDWVAEQSAAFGGAKGTPQKGKEPKACVS